MDLNPILDKQDIAKPGLWYVLSLANDNPSPRVGHTCCVRHSSKTSDSSDSLIIIAGANPDGAFTDAYCLDFDKYSWETHDWPGLPQRYEHAAFIPEYQPNEIIVFGGAQKDGNMNDVQVLDTETQTWCITLPTGVKPDERTCHSACAIGDNLYIFGGGRSGSDPVTDNKIHVYNAKENTWCQPHVSGNAPKSRHGHVMLAVDDNIYIHGGMAGSEIFPDLWQLKIDREKLLWCEPEVCGDVPSERAGHAGSTFENRLFIFGGMNMSGALDDLYSFDTSCFTWQKIKFDGSPPNSRLDHTMCTAAILRGTQDDDCKTKLKQTFLIVFGGMDTSGVIFNDCMAFLLEET